MSHATRVKRLASRPVPITVFDLETSDKLKGRHEKATDGTHPAKYTPGKAPRWATMRFDPDETKDEPPSGWPVPTAKAVQLAARRYLWDPARNVGTLDAEMDILFDDPDLWDCCMAEGAYRTHGISVADCHARGMAPREAWGRFLAMAEGGLLMGQNILGFDVPFANSELLRHGLGAQLDGAGAIDTLLVAREIWSLRSYRLRALADFFAVQTDPALDHDALGDIDTTWQVWEAMQPGLVDHARRFGAGASPSQYRGRLGTLGHAWSRPDAATLVAQLGPAAPLQRDGTPQTEASAGA